MRTLGEQIYPDSPVPVDRECLKKGVNARRKGLGRACCDFAAEEALPACPPSEPLRCSPECGSGHRGKMLRWGHASLPICGPFLAGKIHSPPFTKGRQVVGGLAYLPSADRDRFLIDGPPGSSTRSPIRLHWETAEHPKRAWRFIWVHHIAPRAELKRRIADAKGGRVRRDGRQLDEA